MEQENVRDKYDYNSAWGSAANRNVIDKFIPSYVCPSAPNWASRGIPNGRAPLDYIAFFSVDPANTFINPVPSADQTGQGVMGRGVNRTFAEILDGSSNTILLAVIGLLGSGCSSSNSSPYFPVRGQVLVGSRPAEGARKGQYALILTWVSEPTAATLETGGMDRLGHRYRDPSRSAIQANVVDRAVDLPPIVIPESEVVAVN